MVMEERHHSNGDGMSVGTSSPVSFHDEVTPNMAAVGRHEDSSRLFKYGVVSKGTDQTIGKLGIFIYLVCLLNETCLRISETQLC